MRADALRAVSGRPVMATPVMSQDETMAMTNGGPRQWQPQAATTMQRPVQGMPPRPPEKRSSWVMAVLAGLGVLVVVVLGVALAMSRNNNQPKDGGTQSQAVTVAMPDLTGKTADQAQDLLNQRGLTNIVPEAPTTGEDCTGTVANQNPKANTQIPKDQQVSYQLCQAPEKVEVPDNLVGSTKANADQALRAKGLKPVFKPVNSAKPLDTVTAVEKSGQKVEPNTEITVSISKENQVKMPKVTEQSEETAVALLDQAGSFNVDRKEVPATDPSQVGTVVAQNPAPGTVVEKGDKVTITVAVDSGGGPTGDPSPTDTETPGGNGGGTGGGQVVDQAVAVLRQND
jgi:serine/threonine-protein kinase